MQGSRADGYQKEAESPCGLPDSRRGIALPHRVRGYDGTACIAALYSVRQVSLWAIGASAPCRGGTVVTVLGVEVFNSLEQGILL